MYAFAGYYDNIPVSLVMRITGAVASVHRDRQPESEQAGLIKFQVNTMYTPHSTRIFHASRMYSWTLGRSSPALYKVRLCLCMPS